MTQEKINDFSKRMVCRALRILGESDGGINAQEVFRLVEQKGGIPPEFEKSVKTGAIRWHVAMNWKSTGLVLAGFLRKSKGVWYITDLGREALTKTDDEIVQEMVDAWRRKKEAEKRESEQNPSANLQTVEVDSDDESGEEENSVDYESIASDAISTHIKGLGAYEFQDLCAALLRGMGYHVRDVAPPGPDGGIDIVAYTDQLGVTGRLKVQVKHYAESGNSVGVKPLRELAGVLAPGETGILITSSHFARGCSEFARNNDKHLELIDLPRFIQLWQENYDKLSDADKSMLPLQPIYFLDESRIKRD